MAASFRSDYIWPAAREVVERHDQRAPVPKTPVVRSTHSSRMRSGNAEPEASKGITQVQVRALATSLYPSLASGEAGEKAREWQEKLRAHRAGFGSASHSACAWVRRPERAHEVASPCSVLQRTVASSQAGSRPKSEPQSLDFGRGQEKGRGRCQPG